MVFSCHLPPENQPKYDSLGANGLNCMNTTLLPPDSASCPLPHGSVMPVTSPDPHLRFCITDRWQGKPYVRASPQFHCPVRITAACSPVALQNCTWVLFWFRFFASLDPAFKKKTARFFLKKYILRLT